MRSIKRKIRDIFNIINNRGPNDFIILLESLGYQTSVDHKNDNVGLIYAKR